MQWILVNVPFLIAVVLMLVLMGIAFKNGAIKTIGGIVSAVVSSILVILISFLVREYFYNEKLVMVLTIVLLFLLAVAFMLFNTFFKPIKALSNLGIVKLVDKPLGIVLAVCETVVIIWGIYCILNVMNGGSIEEWTMRCVQENPIMKYLYDNNYIYNLMSGIGNKIMGHEIIAKWILS